ncbi:hypothetical protein E2562_036253 [Oryza meyeriana var. granulata]|uniref:Uncharacterized protein n=1 Tax=Oryza meyeriana var. granulata TaxID=110450 RepID=A0A6G1CZ03_9ORYZ|nr:hypothetical protein E2562_036253 [Oryza meyeriana var. granulata]
MIKIRRKGQRRVEEEIRTTPTFTLSWEGSARNASVTPRMGSLAAGSTWPNHDAIDLAAVAPVHGLGAMFKEKLETKKLKSVKEYTRMAWSAQMTPDRLYLGHIELLPADGLNHRGVTVAAPNDASGYRCSALADSPSSGRATATGSE